MTDLTYRHGMVIVSQIGDGWQYTYYLHGVEHISSQEYPTACASKTAMRKFIDDARANERCET